ncbi:hypothetical protein SUDANB140_05307 [Streptomyces sp. enrichment culture]
MKNGPSTGGRRKNPVGVPRSRLPRGGLVNGAQAGNHLRGRRRRHPRISYAAKAPRAAPDNHFCYWSGYWAVSLARAPDAAISRN